MKLRNDTLKTVGFVMWENLKTNSLEPAGTFFFLGRDPVDSEPYARRMWAVTARHVIDGLRKMGKMDVILRVNAKAGAPILRRVSLDEWYCHPQDESIDVAIFEMGITPEMDQLVIPRNQCVSPASLRRHEAGLGDEIVIAGLFHHHYGKARNIPIIRIGNLIALNEERVETRMGDIDAYLVECRSIGGLSGSPVFLNFGTHRVVGGTLRPSSDGQPTTLLFGLMHGHFDVMPSEVDMPIADDNGDARKINAGVGIVVPIENVLAVIDAYERARPAP